MDKRCGARSEASGNGCAAFGQLNKR